MPKLPKKIEITTDDGGNPVRIKIDGEEFPWYTSDKKMSVEFTGGGLPTLTVVIPAEHIEIDEKAAAAMKPGEDGEDDLGPEND